MKPTRDLARAILPYAANIRILSPDSLRKLVVTMANNACNNNTA
jgi:predicted DNA-binding transcriptional regulator YafY